ncbi:GCN5-related N-acetyltransferase [Glaciecola sp. 4H-3-7+YE-5]|jgi:putative acetyltransferase|nr:GCN5-related N-acetyltransferase [Glaciecola sp. 4H-3-7+YE-5]
MILNINWVVHTVTQSDYSALIAIWEGAVRATHDFLPEEDIAELKSLILQHYFDAVDLRCIKSSSGEMIGFCGVHAQNIEMLFVSPDYVNNGVGRALTKYAIAKQQATKVDVNEQNPKALGFYQRIGFKVVGRSELDGQGKPYPLLHLAL